MKDFKQGDKVGFINEKLNGIVKRIIDKKQVLLLLDDGFEIPVNISELVLLEREKSSQNILEEDNSIVADEVDKTNKLFFAAITEDTGKGVIVKTFLINTTSYLVQFSLFNKTFGQANGLAHGELEASRAIKISDFSLNEAADFRNLLAQVIYFAEKPNVIIAPQEFNFKLKPVSLIKDRTMIPIIKKQGHLIDLSDLKRDEIYNYIPVASDPKKIEKPESLPDLIDLHLEELTENPKALMPHSALELQLKVFNNTLEKAIAQDLKHITFIHGVGQGRLKGEIRKVLGFNPDIQGFEDADPKKFGYGATIVYLKNR